MCKIQLALWLTGNRMGNLNDSAQCCWIQISAVQTQIALAFLQNQRQRSIWFLICAHIPTTASVLNLLADQGSAALPLRRSSPGSLCFTVSKEE